ncbi:MAG: hypothetical protein RL755_2141 [Pseudomonadota bacterium]
MSSGEGLSESEVPMMEFLKKDLINMQAPIPGEMSASLIGKGGVIN